MCCYSLEGKLCGRLLYVVFPEGFSSHLSFVLMQELPLDLMLGGVTVEDNDQWRDCSTDDSRLLEQKNKQRETPTSFP